MNLHLALPIVSALTVLAAACPAQADDFPSRSVRVLVGFASGGNIDISIRINTRKLAEVLGVTVVVENKPGAGGDIAAEAVARSPADDYTLLACGATSHGAHPALFAKLPFNPVKDFAALTMFGTVPSATSPGTPRLPGGIDLGLHALQHATCRGLPAHDLGDPHQR